jgi:hypothetical protein
MNLIDALCIIASSYNARSAEEELVYEDARHLVELHAERVMTEQHRENMRREQNSELFHRGSEPLS